MSRRAFVSMVTAGAPGYRRRSAAPKARNVAEVPHSTTGAAIGLYLDCSVLTVPAALGDRFFCAIRAVLRISASARAFRPLVQLRRRGIVMFPADLGIDVNMATRDLLAAKTIDDLVIASGGLYVPPDKFRPSAAKVTRA
jgi:Malonate decarboxylase, alpha subunit, transporter